jgi:signal transduction histidine kinase
LSLIAFSLLSVKSNPRLSRESGRGYERGAAGTPAPPGEWGGGLASHHTGAGPLDRRNDDADYRRLARRRSIALEAGQVEVLRETLDRLCLEASELRASRRRLVLAADADRRRIERDLHDGVQQHLVALAVNLQLAGQLADTDSQAAKTRLEEMGRDVQQALDETAQLALRIYPPLLEAGGLATALRSAAVSAGIPVTIAVAADASYAPEVARTIYWCWLEALGRAEAQATVAVREENGLVAFEIVEDCARSEAELDGLCDRVEALGGRLTVQSEPGGDTRVSGSLPLT